jgi:hypothetical protein
MTNGFKNDPLPFIFLVWEMVKTWRFLYWPIVSKNLGRLRE